MIQVTYSLYPMPRPRRLRLWRAVEGCIFKWGNGTKLTASWDDLAVLRKDYNDSDIYGDSNSAINTSLSLMDITAQGMSNAIKSTANLKGVIEVQQGNGEGLRMSRKPKTAFVADYLGLCQTNQALPAVTRRQWTYVPIKLEPMIANYKKH